MPSAFNIMSNLERYCDITICTQDLLDDDSEDDYENEIEDLGDCNAENVELQLQKESIAEINNESLRSS
ncbi:hypothetical protein M0802_016080 [Mischocyttarus mexicanus]|nr:hypothetical protein M0802_016080 [Mischocyttarus mexicanus]